MNQDAIANLLKEFKKLSISERNRFLSAVESASSPMDDKAFVDMKFANGIVCPHCESKGKGVTRNGKSETGRQRYLCKHCGKRFTVSTNGVTYNSQKSVKVWKKFLSCMMEGYSVRKTAEECGIHFNTAWRWRHKVLDSLKSIMDSIEMSGIVEADETYFPVSYKGNHKKSKSFNMNRKSHKRGKSIHKRGLSREQVCVPCAVNRNGKSVSQVATLGQPSRKVITSVLRNHVAYGSVLCTDNSSAYCGLVEENALEQIKLSKARRVKGIYHIQHINNYHGKLKGFIDRFNGVSTKYLNNYLLWNNFLNYAKETTSQKMSILINHVLTTNCYTRVEDISQRPALPLVA